jgi:hypothetical protein
MRPLLHSLTATGLALGLSACAAPQVGSPCPIPETNDMAKKAEALKQCFSQTVDIPFNTSLQKDVDILFLIDNSPSMTPKQSALSENIPRFIQAIDKTGANYHVAIASSDIGTQTSAGASWGGGLGPACEKFEGDDGTLQRIPCSLRTFNTQAGKDSCNALCDNPKFVPEGGAGYISKVAGQTNVPKELVKDPMDPNKMIDIGPQKAFQCMALIGDTGCGIEGQLEGAKRALDDHNPMNKGFLRPGSVLAVIFITDEDDCSVAMSKREENTPMSIDCTPGNKNADARCFNPDYRCLARSIACNESMDSAGKKTGCVERDTSYLESVSTYVRFFSALRPANKLLISGVWTPKGGPINIVQKDPNRGVWGLNRATDANAGCFNLNDANLFGQAQIRLSKFASQFKDSIEISICDKENYPKALDSIAAAIKTKLEASCIPIVPTVQNNQPVCLVGDVDARTPNNAPDTAFPLCGGSNSSTCCKAWAAAANPTKDDPAIRAACMNEAADCFCALPSTGGACKDGAVLGVWRKGGGDGPPDKVTNVKCAGK